jgi:tetratricopeptide (TPR) repeat protein
MAIPDIQEALDRIEEGRPEEALPLLATLAERMPTYGAVLTLMARVYEDTGELDEARTAWQHAHFLMPNSPTVHEGLERVTSDAGSEQDTTPEGLILDPDLQAELDAELEALGQGADASFTAPTEEMPMSLAEASLALVEQALAETDVEADEPEEGATEPPETTRESPPDEDPYAKEPFDIYEEIDTLIAQHGDALEDTTEEAAPADVPEARTTEAEAESEEHAAREETVRQVLARAAEAAREEEPGREEDAAEKEPSDDLDRLIQELETARIVPDPDLDDVPEPELDDDIDDMVSETLARIYASQEKYLEAARAYERLAQMQPARADTFMERADEMRARAAQAEDEASPDDDG